MDWSRGNLIAFDQLGSDGYFDVFTMNPDGSGERCLTCGRSELPGRHVGNPAWHPSNDYIVMQVEKSETPANTVSDYFANPGSGINNDIWVMNSAGTRFWQLTNVPVSNGGVLHPHFSPAGDRLLWAERLSASGGTLGTWALRVADFSASGGTPRISNVRTFQPGAQQRFYESSGFSPDGRTILFSGNLESGQGEDAMDIYSLNTDSGALRNLTSNRSDWDEHAQMSPSGSRIVWMSSMGVGGANDPLKVRTDYWMMNADGSEKTQLTYFNDSGHAEFISGGVTSADSSWSPDGTRLMAYVIRSTATGDARMVILDFSSAAIQTDSRADVDVPLGSDVPGLAAASRGAGAQGVPVAAGQAEPFSLRLWNDTIERMLADRRLVRVQSIADPLIEGRVHDRFIQVQDGVPVFGAGLTRQRQGTGAVSIFGTVYPDLSVSGRAAISAEAARDAVATSSGALLAVTEGPALTVVPATDGPARLAYRVRALTRVGTQISLVDAQTATVMATYSEDHPIPRIAGDERPTTASKGAATFDFRGLVQTTVDALGHPGDWMDSFRVPTGTVDRAASSVDAGVRAGLTRLANALGVDLLSDERTPTNVVHPDDPSRAGQRWQAFTRGPFYAGRLTSVYPDTDASAEGFPVGTVAHLLGHAFVDATARLLPRGDAAALAEGTAQVLAIGTASNVLGDTSTAAVEPVLVQVMAGAARQLNRDPNASRSLERIVYRTTAFLLPSDASLSTARHATAQAARDLSLSDAIAKSVDAAWVKAGVQ